MQNISVTYTLSFSEYMFASQVFFDNCMPRAKRSLIAIWLMLFVSSILLYFIKRGPVKPLIVFDSFSMIFLVLLTFIVPAVKYLLEGKRPVSFEAGPEGMGFYDRGHLEAFGWESLRLRESASYIFIGAGKNFYIVPKARLEKQELWGLKGHFA